MWWKPLGGDVSEMSGRNDAFAVIATGVEAGLAAPWRMYLAQGCRYLSISLGNRPEWDGWRAHLGCSDLSVRVYDTGSSIRRSSVAETVRDNCRICVELVEDVSTGDLSMPLDEPEAPGRAA